MITENVIKAIIMLLIVVILYIFLSHRNFVNYCKSVQKVLNVQYHLPATLGQVKSHFATKHNWRYNVRVSETAKEIAGAMQQRRSTDVQDEHEINSV